MKKYELTNITKEVAGKTLYRIKALVSFGNVSAGDLGGYVENESNLSYIGNAWIYNDACVYNGAKVFDNAQIHNNAKIRGNAHIYQNAAVFGNATVFGEANVFGNAQVYGYACIYGNAQIHGNVHVCDDAHLRDNAQVYGDAQVYDNACVYDNAQVYGDAHVRDDASVRGNAMICDNNAYMTIRGLGSENRVTTVCKDNKLGISVKCGCFFGSLTEFCDKVVETHGDCKYAKEYLALVDLIKIHFDLK